MSPTKVTPTLDSTCSFERCRRLGTYTMTATCINCGKVMAIRLTKEHSHPRWNEGPHCPVCGTHNWNGWSIYSGD